MKRYSVGAVLAIGLIAGCAAPELVPADPPSDPAPSVSHSLDPRASDVSVALAAADAAHPGVLTEAAEMPGGLRISYKARAAQSHSFRAELEKRLGTAPLVWEDVGYSKAEGDAVLREAVATVEANGVVVNGGQFVPRENKLLLNVDLSSRSMEIPDVRLGDRVIKVVLVGNLATEPE